MLDTQAGIKLVTLQLLHRLDVLNLPVKVVSIYPKQPAMEYMGYHWLTLPAPVCRHHSVKPLVLTNHLALYKQLLSQTGRDVVQQRGPSLSKILNRAPCLCLSRWRSLPECTCRKTSIALSSSPDHLHCCSRHVQTALLYLHSVCILQLKRDSATFSAFVYVMRQWTETAEHKLSSGTRRAVRSFR